MLVVTETKWGIGEVGKCVKLSSFCSRPLRRRYTVPGIIIDVEVRQLLIRYRRHSAFVPWYGVSAHEFFKSPLNLKTSAVNGLYDCHFIDALAAISPNTVCPINT